LKIEKEFRDDHQVKLTVEIDPEPFDNAKHQAARKLAKRVKIPGFRPGKAPYGVILRQLGEASIVEQALEILVEDQYPKIIKEADIDPYGPGTLETISELDPPTLEFVIPLNTQVELGDYKSISIPYEPPETNDAEVDGAIERIRNQNAIRESVDRPAEPGDVVYMRISAVRTDVEDPNEATIIAERFSSSVIKEDEDENEWPFPGFSKVLIGLSAEDQKTVKHQYPDDYEDEALQGAPAEFNVIVTNIQSSVLPEIDDELAKTASEFDTLEAWKTDLKNNLGEQALATYASEYDDQVINKIVSESAIKYPPQAIESEKKDMLSGLEYRLSQQGISKELYLQIRGINEEALNDEITPVAEDRIKRALVLFEIAKLEEIKPDPDKVQSETGRTVDAIASSMSPKEAKKFVKSAYIPNLINNIAADMITQTTMDYLRATAKGEPWPVIEDQPGNGDETEPMAQTQSEESSTPDESEPTQVGEVQTTEGDTSSEEIETALEANHETTPQDSASSVEEAGAEDENASPEITEGSPEVI
jgi:trigger factor